MAFTVSFRTRFDAEDRMPDGLRVTPLTYSRTIRGGCLMADVQVDGDLLLLWSTLKRLGQRVVISTSLGHPVWWGFVDEVLIRRGNLTDGLSIRRMYNRVRVAYSYQVMGETIAGMTDWAESAESINLLGFVRELMETTEIDASPNLAAAKRDTLLSLFSVPPAISEEGGGSGSPHVLVRCSGDINSLAWRYYDQPAGLIEHEGSDKIEHPLGVALTSTAIGFNRHGRIYDMGGRFNTFPNNVHIQIAGAGSNNGVRLVKIVDSRPARSYTSNTIAFDSADDIFDHANGDLSFVEVDDYIRVTGSGDAVNNGYKQVKTAGGGHLEVRPQNNQPHSGSTVTIARGNYIETEEGGVTAFPNDAVSVSIITHGVEIAQAFRQPVNAGVWTLERVELRVKKVGNPSDFLRVNFCFTQPGNLPGAVIESSILAGANIGTEFSTQAFRFSNTSNVMPDMTFWLQIQRGGVYSATDYYVVELDGAATYTGGGLLMWDGSQWVASNSSLVFRVLGAWETTRQMREIINRTGQYINRLDIRTGSHVYSNQYRDGQALAYDEMLALLDAGTVDGAQLIADVTIEHILRITRATVVEPTDAVQQTADGRYLDSNGRPLQEGLLPVGQYVARPDIPSAAARAFRMSPRLVEEAEYDCKANRIRRVRFQGDPDPADILGI